MKEGLARLEELREKCEAILRGEGDAFALDVSEALDALAALFSRWRRAEEMQADAHVFALLAEVLCLQSRRAVEQAALLAVDPSLIAQKVASSSPAQLASCLVVSWRRLAVIEQLGPERLREAIEYYLSLAPLRARSLRLGRPRTFVPGRLSRQEMAELRQLQEVELEQELKKLEDELEEKGEADYYSFVYAKGEELAAFRALLVAHLVSRGRAALDVNPLEGKLTLRRLNPGEPLGVPRSVAVPLRR